MRFTNLLTLLAATSALALNFKRDEQLNQLENILGEAQSQQSKQSGSNMDPATAFACMGILTSFLDKCYGVAMNEKTIENLEVAVKNVDCKKISSDGCQSAMKELSNSKCSNEDLDSSMPYYNMVCAVDENGNPCPISESFQKYMENPEAANSNNALTDKEIEDTCKSSKCTETALSIMDQIMKNGKASDKKEVETYINAFNSDKCKAAASTVAGTVNTANNTDSTDSGETQIKMGSALLATLALALYLF